MKIVVKIKEKLKEHKATYEKLHLIVVLIP